MLNKVEIIGRVGKEPEVRHTQTAIKVVNLTVAVSESWKDAQGQRQERTEWVPVVVFTKSEYIERYCHKGDLVYVCGKMQTRNYEKDRIAARQKVAEKEVERINSTILFALKNTGKDKVTAGTFTVSTRKSSQLIVDEDNFNDDRFIEKFVTQKIDKMAIKQAIKQGEVIDGCRIKEVENLQVK